MLDLSVALIVVCGFFSTALLLCRTVERCVDIYTERKYNQIFQQLEREEPTTTQEADVEENSKIPSMDEIIKTINIMWEGDVHEDGRN